MLLMTSTVPLGSVCELSVVATLSGVIRAPEELGVNPPSPHFSNYLCAPIFTIALCFLIFSARRSARVFIQPGAGCLAGIGWSFGGKVSGGPRGCQAAECSAAQAAA